MQQVDPNILDLKLCLQLLAITIGLVLVRFYHRKWKSSHDRRLNWQKFALETFLESVEPLNSDTCLESIPPEQHRPFNPPRMSALSMGLRKITPKDWLMIDRDLKSTLEDKKIAIEMYPTELIGANHCATKAIHECYNTVVNFLTTRYPRYYNFEEKHLNNKVMGTKLPINAASSNLSNIELLTLMAKNFEEDFLLLDSEDDEFVLRAGSFVYPAGFNPAKLMNKTLDQIHGPVPYYPERLQSPMTRFFAKIKAGEVYQRLNWSLQQGTKLSIPHVSEGSSLGRKESEDVEKNEAPVFDPKKMYVRVERQTLTRLPMSGYVLFTIRTYLYKVSDIKEEGLGASLAQSIDNLDFHFGRYKGKDRWGEVVMEYLRQ